MILLPLRHESMTVRRLPWVSFVLVGLCLLAHVLVLTTAGDAEERHASAVREAIEYWIEHPYLELNGKAAETVRELLGERNATGLSVMPADVDDERRQAEQQELDRLFRAVEDVTGGHPLFRFGLVPKAMTLAGLLGHMFLHGGWMHLLGNMFFLYLVGPFVEDAWGRPLFGSFYVLAGIVAGGGFALRYPGLEIPLIGASGAVAGLMGAFLIRFWQTKIQFFYAMGIWLRGTFWAPSWLMLPLWLLQQVFWALMMDGLTEDGVGGVAYWAHVFGFVFGVGVALLVRALKVEERYVAPVITAKTTTTVEGAATIEEAYARRAAGDLAGGLDLLRTAWNERPGNPDLGLVLWVFSVDAQCADTAGPVLLDVIRHELRTGETDLVAQHWAELQQHAPATPADVTTLLRLAPVLAQQNHDVAARDALALALRLGGTALPGPMALRIAREAARLDVRVSAAAAELALRCQDLSPLERTEAERLVATAGATR